MNGYSKDESERRLRKPDNLRHATRTSNLIGETSKAYMTPSFFRHGQHFDGDDDGTGEGTNSQQLRPMKFIH
jgi:hypothetical protein